MAWYCISFGLIARYHTVMYRCYSAPANYRVVHLVIFIDAVGSLVFTVFGLNKIPEDMESVLPVATPIATHHTCIDEHSLGGRGRLSFFYGTQLYRYACYNHVETYFSNSTLLAICPINVKHKMLKLFHHFNLKIWIGLCLVSWCHIRIFLSISELQEKWTIRILPE